jgi:hypothetical protein
MDKIYDKFKHGDDPDPDLNIFSYMRLMKAYEYKKAKKLAEEWFKKEWDDFIKFL